MQNGTIRGVSYQGSLIGVTIESEDDSGSWTFYGDARPTAQALEALGYEGLPLDVQFEADGMLLLQLGEA